MLCIYDINTYIFCENSLWTSACFTGMSSLQCQSTVRPVDTKLGLGTADSSSLIPLHPFRSTISLSFFPSTAVRCSSCFLNEGGEAGREKGMKEKSQGRRQELCLHLASHIISGKLINSLKLEYFYS